VPPKDPACKTSFGVLLGLKSGTSSKTSSPFEFLLPSCGLTSFEDFDDLDAAGVVFEGVGFDTSGGGGESTVSLGIGSLLLFVSESFSNSAIFDMFADAA